MTKVLAMVCILGSTFALTACNSTGSGYVDTQAPYSANRTAGGPVAAAPVKSAAPVFEKKVTK